MPSDTIRHDCPVIAGDSWLRAGLPRFSSPSTTLLRSTDAPPGLPVLGSAATAPGMRAVLHPVCRCRCG